MPIYPWTLNTPKLIKNLCTCLDRKLTRVMSLKIHKYVNKVWLTNLPQQYIGQPEDQIKM